MNWEALGAVAELLGAVGVIASLFYVGTEIRRNTRSVRASSYHSVVTNLSNLSGAMGRDSEAANLFMSGMDDFDSLSSKQRAQFFILCVSLFRSYENIFYQHTEGMIDDSVWPGWAHSMRRYFWQPGVQRWWPSWRNDCHTEFRDFLEHSTAVEDDRVFADLFGHPDAPAP